jgi:hypothetical protein
VAAVMTLETVILCNCVDSAIIKCPWTGKGKRQNVSRQAVRRVARGCSQAQKGSHLKREDSSYAAKGFREAKKSSCLHFVVEHYFWQLQMMKQKRDDVIEGHLTRIHVRRKNARDAAQHDD